jgi:hypothetical protein
MSIDLKIILLLILSQVFLFLSHITVLRILIKKRAAFSPLLAAVKCALFGNIPLLVITRFLLPGKETGVYGISGAILYVLIIYNALSYSYCHVFNMSETARRIRMLYELNLAGRVSYNELAGKYGSGNMVDARLERLMEMKQVSKHEGRFVLRSRMLYRIGMAVLNWGFFLKYNTGLKKDLKGRGVEVS